MCGIPTTRNDTRRVVPNREVVSRDLGCRCGGIEEVDRRLLLGDVIEHHQLSLRGR